MPAHDHPAQLWQFYDGDSVWLLVRLSFGQGAFPEVRLLDVEAPEMRELRLPRMRGPRGPEPGAVEATAEVTRWVGQTMVEAKDATRFYLAVRTVIPKVADPREKQTFTRYLATVWPWLHRPADFLPDHLPASTPGMSLNEHMIGWLREHGWTNPF